MKTVRSNLQNSSLVTLGLALASVWLVTGCGKLDLAITTKPSESLPFFQKAVGTEVVSSSVVEQNTFNGFKVTTSVGYFLSEPSVKTASGFKVHQSVQGQALAQ